MNRQIEALLINPYGTDYTVNPPMDIYRDEEMIKFAKVIIKECAKVIDTLDESYDAPRTHSKFLLKHFGIEK